jgi:hypothetical protein
MNDLIKQMRENAEKAIKFYSDNFIKTGENDYDIGKKYADIICSIIKNESEDFVQGVMDRFVDPL